MKRKANQSQIAKQLGISKSYLSMILNGQRKCSPELVSQLQIVHRSSQKRINFKADLSLRGRCPRPLDECATLADHSGHIANFLKPDLVPRLRQLLRKSGPLSPRP